MILIDKQVSIVLFYFLRYALVVQQVAQVLLHIVEVQQVLLFLVVAIAVLPFGCQVKQQFNIRFLVFIDHWPVPYSCQLIAQLRTLGGNGLQFLEQAIHLSIPGNIRILYASP